MPKKEKKCITCGKIKPLSSFGWSSKKNGSRRNQCKVCRGLYRKSLANREGVAVEEKVCRTCKIPLPASHFPADSMSIDKLSYRCRGCHQKYAVKYRSSENGQKVRRRLRKKYHEKYGATPEGKIRRSVSRSIGEALRSRGTKKAGKSAWKHLPYNIPELIANIESKFEPGMAWENYGKWHIDHIVAHAHFHYVTMEDPEFELCWSLVNLRPMWAKPNMEKGVLSREEYRKRCQDKDSGS